MVLLHILRCVVLGDLDIVDPVVLLDSGAFDVQLGSIGSCGGLAHVIVQHGTGHVAVQNVLNSLGQCIDADQIDVLADGAAGLLDGLQSAQCHCVVVAEHDFDLIAVLRQSVCNVLLSSSLIPVVQVLVQALDFLAGIGQSLDGVLGAVLSVDVLGVALAHDVGDLAVAVDVALVLGVEDQLALEGAGLSGIAANVDQAFLVVTVERPQTSTTFIDRFLATAEAYSVPVVLVFNKTDLLDDSLMRYQRMMTDLYETVGYKCVAVSAETGEGMDELMEMLRDRITLLSGHSGVGKSTIINRLLPGVNLRTAEISDAHNTGMHTTTFSEMLPLPGGGYIIDTPGIKGFGTFDMEPEELTSYFKEIFRFSKDCRFSNCTHTHEPGCAVLKAVEDHYIAASRYQSYLSMLEDKDGNKYREAY